MKNLIGALTVAAFAVVLSACGDGTTTTVTTASPTPVGSVASPSVSVTASTTAPK